MIKPTAKIFLNVTTTCIFSKNYLANYFPRRIRTYRNLLTVELYEHPVVFADRLNHKVSIWNSSTILSVFADCVKQERQV